MNIKKIEYFNRGGGKTKSRSNQWTINKYAQWKNQRALSINSMKLCNDNKINFYLFITSAIFEMNELMNF